MRLLVIPVLILALLMQVFSKTIIYTSFLVNQEYIAKNLCENRAVPGKHCCGKCQLKKSMEREQKQDSFPASFRSADENVFDAYVAVSEFKHGVSTAIAYPGYSRFIPVVFGEAVFHPPSFL
jgi:hypothetical protein